MICDLCKKEADALKEVSVCMGCIFPSDTLATDARELAKLCEMMAKRNWTTSDESLYEVERLYKTILNMTGG